MNLVVNSRFNPYTYAELVKPLEDYTKAYKEAEEQYIDLANQTEVLRDIADKDINPESYKYFNQYSKDLEEAVEDFSKGMNISNGSKLLNLRRRYAKEIIPIISAENRRQEYLKHRRDLSSKDSSIFYKTDNIKTDDFLHGKTIDEDYISGNDVISKTSTKATLLANALFSDPEFKSILGGQQYQVYQQNGMSAYDFINVVSNNIENNPSISNSLKQKLRAFRQIYDEGMKRVDNWGQDARNKMSQALITGLYAGLSKPTYNYVANRGYEEPLNPLQREQLRGLRLENDFIEGAIKAGEYGGKGKLKNKGSNSGYVALAEGATYDVFGTVENGNVEGYTSTEKIYDKDGYSPRKFEDLSKENQEIVLRHINNESDINLYNYYEKGKKGFYQLNIKPRAIKKGEVDSKEGSDNQDNPDEL